jgi:hypothetical protein
VTRDELLRLVTTHLDRDGEPWSQQSGSVLSSAGVLQGSSVQAHSHPTPFGVRRCGERSGVRTPAYGWGRERRPRPRWPMA